MPDEKLRERVTFQAFMSTIDQFLETLTLTREDWFRLLAPSLDSTGRPRLMMTSAGKQVDSPVTSQAPAEASDGVALLSSPSAMLSTTVQVDSDGAGTIASTAVLAAGGAGVKYVIYEVRASGMIIATPGAPAGAHLVFSDTGLVLTVPGGGQGVALGPTKQGTANTAINVSVAAGYATPSSRFTITVMYRLGT